MTKQVLTAGFRRVAIALAAGAGLACLAAVPAQAAGDWTGNANLYFGQKVLNSDWKFEAEIDDLDLSKQWAYGIEADLAQKEWPVNIAVGLYYSSKKKSVSDSIDTGDGILTGDESLKATTWELDLGAKKYFAVTPMVSPFVGGGLAIERVKVEYNLDVAFDGTPDPDLSGTESKTKMAYGAWLAGGVQVTLAENVNLGAEVKWNPYMTKADFGSDSKTKMTSWQYGIFAGYHF